MSPLSHFIPLLEKASHLGERSDDLSTRELARIHATNAALLKNSNINPTQAFEWYLDMEPEARKGIIRRERGSWLPGSIEALAKVVEKLGDYWTQWEVNESFAWPGKSACTSV